MDVNPNPDVDRAILAITGYGSSTIPHRAFEGVRDLFAAGGPELERQVLGVFATLDRFEPDWGSSDLVEATRQARAYVASRHPGVGDAALDALAWLFSFEMR